MDSISQAMTLGHDFRRYLQTNILLQLDELDFGRFHMPESEARRQLPLSMLSSMQDQNIGDTHLLKDLLPEFMTRIQSQESNAIQGTLTRFNSESPATAINNQDISSKLIPEPELDDQDNTSTLFLEAA
eukprot:scaffold14869_cov69-Skeletonema_dohrnii-CCMP3373.AAC.1